MPKSRLSLLVSQELKKQGYKYSTLGTYTLNTTYLLDRVPKPVIVLEYVTCKIKEKPHATVVGSVQSIGRLSDWSTVQTCFQVPTFENRQLEAWSNRILFYLLP